MGVSAHVCLARPSSIRANDLYQSRPVRGIKAWVLLREARELWVTAGSQARVAAFDRFQQYGIALSLNLRPRSPRFPRPFPCAQHPATPAPWRAAFGGCLTAKPCDSLVHQARHRAVPSRQKQSVASGAPALRSSLTHGQQPCVASSGEFTAHARTLRQASRMRRPAQPDAVRRVPAAFAPGAPPCPTPHPAPPAAPAGPRPQLRKLWRRPARLGGFGHPVRRPAAAGGAPP
jgi:hypothetical protein